MRVVEVLGPAPVVRPEPGFGCDYKLIESVDELWAYVDPVLTGAVPLYGADCEASSLNTHLAHLAGVSFSIGPKSARYAPVGHLVDTHLNLPLPAVLDVLRALDTVELGHGVWFNVLYDLALLSVRYQLSLRRWHDAQHGVFLVNSNVIELGLKVSASRFLGLKLQEITDLDAEWVQLSRAQQKRQPPTPVHELSPRTVMAYACDDAMAARALWVHKDVQAAIKEQASVLKLEEALSPVMREGNAYGAYLDRERLGQLDVEASERLDALTPQIMAHFKEPFALSRKKKLAEELFVLCPEIAERTKGGAPTAATKVLDKYRHLHPVIPLLIQWAQLDAQQRNYIRKLARAYDYFAKEPWAEGRVRFAFGHIGVPTGRMKCGGGGRGVEAYAKGVADVNTQSIPDAEKAPYLPNTRSAYVAPDGWVVVAIDYNQVEVRIAANESCEPKWIQTYRQGGDIHLTNAQAIANAREPGLVVAKDDKKRRGHAKTTTFALLYGGDEHTVSRNAGVPVAEAKAIFEAFFAGLPTLKYWIDSLHRTAESTKQVKTFLGRVRRLEGYFHPEPPRPPRGTPKTDLAYRKWVLWWQLRNRGFREAVNHPVQGGAADVFKLACVKVDQAMRARGWHDWTFVSPQVLWEHDELVLYVRADKVRDVVPVLVEAMEFRVPRWDGRVPLKVDVEIGDRWLYLDAKRKAALKAHEDPTGYERQMATVPEGAFTGRYSSWGELVPYEHWCELRPAGGNISRGVSVSSPRGAMADLVAVS